jgi:hypothetical protein
MKNRTRDTVELLGPEGGRLAVDRNSADHRRLVGEGFLTRDGETGLKPIEPQSDPEPVEPPVFEEDSDEG